MPGIGSAKKAVQSSGDFQTNRGIMMETVIDRGIASLGNEALAWFNERSTIVCGYGWCLGVSGANPNAIRRKIVEAVGVQS